MKDKYKYSFLYGILTSLIIILSFDFTLSQINLREVPSPRWSLDEETCLLVPKKNLNFVSNKYENREISFKTNKLGYRESDEIFDQKNLNLVIGDSLAWGYYLNYNETISYHLNKVYETNRWINAGSFGSSPLEYFYALKEIHLKKNKLKINRILVILNHWNDVQETTHFTTFENKLIHNKAFVYNNYRSRLLKDRKSNIDCINSVSFYDKTLAFLENYSFYFKNIINPYLNPKKKEDFFDPNVYWSYYNQDVKNVALDWKRFFDSVIKIKNLAYKNNIKVDFVVSPVPWEISKEFNQFWGFNIDRFDDFQKPRLKLISFLEKNNLKYLDLTNCFKNNEIHLTDNIFMRDNRDVHYSSKGNQLISNCFKKYDIGN